MARSRPWSLPKKAIKATPHKWQNNQNYKLYNSHRWRKVATGYRKKHPLCVVSYEKGKHVPAEVLDHIIPIEHGGAVWDKRNWQGLCHKEHNRKSAQEKESPIYKSEKNENGDLIPIRIDEKLQLI